MAAPAAATPDTAEDIGSYREATYTSSPGVNEALLPLHCGVSVRIEGNRYTISGGGYTRCDGNVARIQHNVKIQRSRWYGWETVAKKSDEKWNNSAHSSWLDYDCAGTGIHDYRVVVTGVATPYGESPRTARAYDQIDEYNCGG
ncbi:hypothetical protein [Longimycelium tulufanense]|uniref:hypothetical protein n=1 Tax=Longimycelium tulufanense TaxID=907463 RepID=UPI001E45CE21|nr:hypothetical protein [Longimycelium tulufanense]